MHPEPFTIAVDQAVLDDLAARLAATRWPDQIADGWSQGTDTAYLKNLCTYWGDGFDWRTEEARLNALPQFRAESDGSTIHYVHMKSTAAAGPKRPRADFFPPGSKPDLFVDDLAAFAEAAGLPH